MGISRTHHKLCLSLVVHTARCLVSDHQRILRLTVAFFVTATAIVVEVMVVVVAKVMMIVHHGPRSSSVLDILGGGRHHHHRRHPIDQQVLLGRFDHQHLIAAH